MLISYIIPVHNSELTLQVCLDSFFLQTDQEEDELVLVIDGEDQEASFKIASEYQEKHPNIQIIYPKQRMGAFHTRIEGIKHAQGEFIGFIDSDDTLPEGCLSTLHPKIKEADVDVFNFSFYVKKKKGGHKNAFTAKERALSQKEAFKYLMQDKAIRGFLWTKIYRASFLKGFTPLAMQGNDALFEDVLFNVHAFATAKTFYYTNAIFYNYHQVGMATAVRKSRTNRTMYHLATFASIRMFLEKNGMKDLLECFYKSKGRAYWSIWYDLIQDKKFGLDKAVRKRLKACYKLIFDPSKSLQISPLYKEFIDPSLLK